MLMPVTGNAVTPGLRLMRRLRALLTLAALCGVSVTTPALAQQADASGWFEAPGDDAAAPLPTEPDYEEPDLVGDPAPAAPEPAPAPVSDVPDTDPSALTTFRPALDPYGAWVSDSRYGTVWVPNREVVGSDFAPYVSRGHWSLTADNDWIWVSDYPFGWAVFHYGRWVWLPGGGWAWVPGRTYANAWVVWRTPVAGYAYVGWAPMPPTWGWWNGYAVGVWYSPPLPYVFCPSAYVFDYRVHYHVVRDRALVRDIAQHTRVEPTTYHAPAQPSAHAASVAGGRAAPPPIMASRAPRGPAVSAARVPPSAIPAVRTAPPPNAVRLSPARLGPTDFTSRRVPSEARVRSTVRSPSSSRESFSSSRESFTAPPARRASPSMSWSTERAPSAPARTRIEPRHVSPSQVSPSRISPSRIRVAPSPSYRVSPAPAIRSVPAPAMRAPSMPRSFSTPHFHGGGIRRR
jgi:hypothetical protein